MSVLLYRFDDPAAFPILESQTTGPGAWRVTATEENGEPAMRVAWEPAGAKASAAALCLALPRIAVDGSPVRLGLALRGDGSQCRFFVDAGDARGPGFRYGLGPVSFEGVRTCWTDVDRPAEYWDGAAPRNLPAMVPPLQLHRLVVTAAPPTKRINIALLRMLVTGEVRLATPAIA